MSGKTEIEFINCGDVQIAASCEMEKCEDVQAYYPSTVLIYMEQGQLNLKSNGQLYIVPEKGYALIKKYTHGTYFKTWSEEQDNARSIAFLLDNEFVRSAVESLGLPDNNQEIKEFFTPLQENTILKGLMHSIRDYLDEKAALEPELVSLKIKEAILGIVKADASLLHLFHHYSKNEKADLVTFMNYNYLMNFSLDTFAKQSGRSLSSFKREFKELFNTTPHKWIMEKRLLYARHLMESKKLKASDVYIEAGFEDLAHFSRSFKKQFNVSPSQVYS